MKSRLLTRIVALITGILLIAAVIIGFSVIKDKLAAPAKTAEETVTDTAEAPNGTIKGPFCLRMTYPKISSQTYVSFNIYYLHEGMEELWYSCGRMFAANDVRSIAWANDQYDVAVTLKSGKQEVFSYDGSSNWQ